MFAQRLAGHSAARITRALNDAGIPCPSAADPDRNPHRTGAVWTLRTVAAILANPRYTGRQVWNRQRTDFDLVDPANTGLGHRQVQRWNLPEGWVISRHPAHPALVSEADFIAVQDVTAPRGPAGPACAGTCWPGCWPAGVRAAAGSAWPTASPPTGAATATPAPPARNLAGQEHLRARGPDPAHRPPPPSFSPAAARRTADGTGRAHHPGRDRPPGRPLRTADVILTYDPGTLTIRTGDDDPIAVTMGRHP